MFKANKALLAGAVALLSTMSSNGFAHTVIQNSSITATAGVTPNNYNALRIGHSCEYGDDGDHRDVVAQSALFPTGGTDAYITTFDGTTHTVVDDVTVENILGSSLAGKFQPISSNEIFAKQSLKQDASGNIIGFNSYKGHFQQGFVGLVPFYMKTLTISDTSATAIGACTNKLLIKVAIADICKTKGIKAGNVNLWIPNTTTKYTEVVDGTSATTRAGSPATITIDNSGACPEGKTVVIWPEDAYIDANFAIPKVWK